MLVPPQFDHNRRSVLHTSNDCCMRGLPTVADPVVKDQVAPIAAVRGDRREPAWGPNHLQGSRYLYLRSDMTAIRVVASYWKVIMSVRLSVGALGFKGWFVRLPLNWFNI